MKRTWFSLGILAVLVGLTIYFNVTKANTNEVRAEEGYISPNFTIEDMEGNIVSLDDFKGKPVFINFWASWCGPCRDEMPFIDEAYQKYKDQIGFLMINEIETEKKKLSSVESFMQEFNLSFPVLLDRQSKVADLYKVYGYPTSYFINSNGTIIKMVPGGMFKSDFDKLIQILLQD